MELTQSEENRNRAISAGATLLIFALFILFLILFKIITPNPPFPEIGGGGGQELALGMMDMGNSDMDFSTMGKATAVVTQKAETKESIVTDVDGEAVNINEKQPEIKENKMVVTPIKPKPVVEPVKEKTAAEKLAEKFKKNTGQNGGGIGDNQTAGQNGSPDGDPFKNGTGGSGTGSGGGNGVGDGPGGPGPGSGGGTGGRIGVDLKGRAIVSPPKIPSDTKEEGKVVVEITVDANGVVIEANPNGRGTTTSSALLKAKAKQAALATKFNVDGKFEEQKGTITIIFSFN
jgi:outer membrane biosynthesis protein TonB